jgi:F0F1-type ATP synthase assembly protein I
VIEEEFDETTQKTRIRTIYRGSKLEAGNAAALERSKETRARVAQQKAEIAQEKQRKAAAAERKAHEANPFRLVTVFALIALVGLGAVIGLRFLYDLM